MNVSPVAGWASGDGCNWGLRNSGKEKPGGSKERRADVAAVLSAYREALGESGNSIAGVALLGLECATADDAPLAGHPDRDLALRTVARFAVDSACDVRSRLAAVQVCAVAGQAQALPAIRTLAADPTTTTALRAAALRATGLVRRAAAGIAPNVDGATHWLGKPVVAGLLPRCQRQYRRGYDASPHQLVHRN